MSTEDRLLDRLGQGEIALPPPGRMTEEEFAVWCNQDTRAEWVDGEVVMMAPLAWEQSDLGAWLLSLLRYFVEDRDLGVVVYEFQVRLATQQRRRVPDICFIAKGRRDLVRRAHLEGPPDLCVEIVSPDSQARDWREKYLEYEAAGVREYWVIDPTSQHVEVYAMDNPSPAEAPQSPRSAYRRLEEKDGRLVSTVLPGFFLRPVWLWPQARPTLMAALREVGVVPSGER
jgi:Uma2 family endonuclease